MFRLLVLLSFFIFGVISQFPPHVEAQPIKEMVSAEKEIKKLIKQKEEAVNQKNRVRFLTIINPDDKFYLNEQKRWFDDAILFIDPGSFHLQVKSMIPESEHLFRVWIQQSYARKGKMYAVQYPLLVKRTVHGWKDADLAFKKMSSDIVTIRFTDENLLDQAHIALDILKRGAYVFKNRYGWMPKQIEVKLYDHAETFRQSVKPSLPFWAGGWHESGESIKFIAGMSNIRILASGLVHELTHQMISEMTHDNAAYWLQEGAAMYYEKHLLPGLHEKRNLEENVETPAFTLPQLERINLEELSDQKAYQYYQSCYQLFEFMVNHYGEKQIQDLLAVLKISEEIDQDSVHKMNLLNERTREAIKQTLGVSIEELDRKWKLSRG